MHGFRNWLVENLTGGAPTHYEGQKPHHEYHTEDGHHIQVHVSKNEKGSHAVFINKSLGGHVTKLVHWNVGAKQPSKSELEQMGKGGEEEDAHLREHYQLSEAAAKKAEKEEQHVINGKMTPNTGGKVAEHATMAYLIGHKHAHAGTTGSPEHLAELKEHEDEIKRITKGVADPKSVETRMEHGRAAANLILQHVKEKHGPDAKIVNVGHTAKPGDIAKFTRGVHTNDTQKNNPSDVAVEVSGSRLKPHKRNSDGTHFEGYSLKSSEKAAEITANNPAIHLHGMLDAPGRKLNTDKVSRDSLKKYVHKPLGGEGKIAAVRSKEIKAAREANTTGNKTELEQKASEGGRKAIDAVTSEFHKHLQHLTTKEGDEGHHLIGKMLKQHLVADSDMPWAKVKSKGDQKEKVKASLTGGSESPLKKILNDKKTKFSVQRKAGSPTVNVGYLHPETGEHVTLAKYTPKTKSNAYKSDVHGWNVVPASHH